MSTARLKEELSKRHVVEEDSLENMSTTKLQRLLKKYGSTAVYRELNDPVGVCPLDFESAIRSISWGVFYAVALSGVSTGGGGGGGGGGKRDEDDDNDKEEGSTAKGKKRTPMIDSLVRHAEITDSFSIFDSTLATALVEHSWKQYAGKLFKTEAVLYTMMVLAFTWAAITSNYACGVTQQRAATTLSKGPTDLSRSSNDDDELGLDLLLTVAQQLELRQTAPVATSFTTTVTAALLVFRLLFMEAKHLQRARTRYVGDALKILQIVSYLLALGSIALHCIDLVAIVRWHDNTTRSSILGEQGEEGEDADTTWFGNALTRCEAQRSSPWKNVHALAGGLLWICMLVYMRGFELTQTAVPMIQKICIEALPYFGPRRTSFLRCHFVTTKSRTYLPRWARDKHRKRRDKKRRFLLQGFSSPFSLAFRSCSCTFWAREMRTSQRCTRHLRWRSSPHSG